MLQSGYQNQIIQGLECKLIKVSKATFVTNPNRNDNYMPLLVNLYWQSFGTSYVRILRTVHKIS